MPMRSGKIYFIISAYNEEENVGLLCKQLISEMALLQHSDYELVFINDGSKDATLENLIQLQKHNKNIVIINQTKNFGHELAMTAGLNYAVHDNHSAHYCILFMDADLQHPPKIAGEMVKLWLSGKNLILTKRTDNLDKGFRYKLLGNTYYWLLNLISEVKIPRNMPDFRLLDKKYVIWMNSLNETDRMFRGMLSLIGLRDATIINFEAPQRNAGKSKYNFWNLYKLAIDSVIQFSVKPLRIATLIGVLGCFLSFMFLLYSIYISLVHNEPRTGFLTLLAVTVFFSSLIILFLGIIGEYIGRIHIQVKNRPLYFNEVIKNEEG